MRQVFLYSLHRDRLCGQNGCEDSTWKDIRCDSYQYIGHENHVNFPLIWHDDAWDDLPGNNNKVHGCNPEGICHLIILYC